MGFLDFFRPKYQHSNPEVRAEAVRDLDSDHASILAEIARRDPEERIRRIAIKKIDDPQVLRDIARGDSDEALRRTAAEKADELLLATATGGDRTAALAALAELSGGQVLDVARRTNVAEVAVAAVARISTERALADVAMRAVHADARRQAVTRLEEEESLAAVATGAADKSVGLAALERIRDAGRLERVAEDAKVKAVRKAAQERLPAREAEARRSGVVKAEKKTNRALMLQVCLMAESAAKLANQADAEAALAEARARWAELHGEDEALTRRFEAAFHGYDERKQAERARARTEAEAKAMREAKARAEADREKAEADAAVQAEATRARVEADRGRVRAERSAEREARAPKAPASKLESITAEAERLAGKRTSAKRWAELQTEWETAALNRETGETGSLGEEAQRVLRARFEAASGEAAARRQADEAKAEEERAERRRTMSEACLALERVAEKSDRKKAETTLKFTAQAVGQLRAGDDEELRTRYAAARDRVQVMVGELREAEQWKRWADLPKLEELCKKAEALAEILETVEDKQHVPTVLKDLQAEWKKASAGAPRQSLQVLSERFQAATKRVHEGTREFFARRDEQRGDNLKKKEELAAKAEALVQSSDWKATTEELKRLQAEWKAIGHVPREQGDAVWKRFRGACDKFFERLGAENQVRDAERGENLAQKVALCEKAEALSTSTDWRETAEDIKQLQSDWKEIGPVPKDQSETIYARFRAACDTFFDARKVAWEQMDTQRAANLARKEELVQRAVALAAVADLDQAMDEAKSLMAEWKVVGPVPRDAGDDVWERFRNACDAVFDRERPQVASAEGMGVSGFANRLPLEKLSAVKPSAEAKKDPGTESSSPVDDGWDA